ncbi:protein SCAI-like isoform X5 [Homarus americanus]|uniref:protein SCAI-like isoform X5 n=1 Tax=Homarus americanus TaxID=6706 RepID=UPI001C45A7BA|nr:protein SCAI-like isoform X5 [Homarus americanus]
MAEMDEHERKIVNEFCHLLEKSKQLFNGLRSFFSRDLPQYGHKQWQAYFGRTFDIYTKLWKFQQQHRQILDSKFGLKRWQIGEIASKIGQLYYHYYLRTSETNYLNEAFSFYAAIRGRAYYSRTAKDDRSVQMSDLMVKKLRYYARFIVVCLLLKRMKLVRDLVRELSKQIDEYTTTYEPEDQLEWSLVLAEIKSFIDADNTINVLDMDSNTIVLSHRLSGHNTPPLEKTPMMNLTLQEILIVGNCNDQVKFSELTIDMFRMLQTLEREPQEDVAQIYDASPAPNKIPFENGDASGRTLKRENPHKYLLYKPTFSQLMVFLASGFKELPANGAMLLYISADGAFTSSKHPQDHQHHRGNLFTLFLHSPLMGMCLVSSLCDVPMNLWEKCQTLVDRFITEASRLVTRGRNVDPSFLQFFGDDFLRLLTLRFIFCSTVLRAHRAFKVLDQPLHEKQGRQFYPRCHPNLPEGEVLDHPSLYAIILDLATTLDVSHLFYDTHDLQ